MVDIINKSGIKISPKYFQQDWNNLDLSKNDPEAWQKAIEIFKDRMEGRYFRQIKALDWGFRQ